MDQILTADGKPMRVWGSMSQERVDEILAKEAEQEEKLQKELIDDREARHKITANNAERAAKMSPAEKAEAAALLGADDEEVSRIAKGFKCGCGKFPREGEPAATLRSVQGHARRMNCKPEDIIGPDGKPVRVVGMGG